MNDKECELLFGYLKSILYDSEIKALDIEALDEPYRKLGRGLQYLQEAVEEMQEYSRDLSRGNLSGKIPSRDNFLCNNLKNLHANLNHLTWQAQQVAAGDYSQHVSYLGEFSDAFNTMTAQLKEREAFLKEQAEVVKKRAEVIESYNELLMELTRKRREWILVVDEESKDIVYCNKRMEAEQVDFRQCQVCSYRLPILEYILNWGGERQYRVWEKDEGPAGFYRVTTFPIEWRGRTAWVHIMQDITEMKQEERRLANKAYHDPLTGIYNRRFLDERMELLLKIKVHFILCYMDLDGLKYINDRFGHSEGDRYIRLFADTVKSLFRNTDTFARIGGDEFCIILENCTLEVAKHKISEAQKLFQQKSSRYQNNFSYGLVDVRKEKLNMQQKEILELADAAMYECKRKHKIQRKQDDFSGVRQETE